jgi:tetratricopeptide (TPR) repeat protein
MDIGRHLNDETVIARPPSNVYRFQKLFRRNKLAFAAAGGIAAALLIGLAISAWGLIKQQQARHEAERHATTSRQVARFLTHILDEVAPAVARRHDPALLSEILDETEQRLGKDLSGQPGVEAELLYTLGELYWDLGQLERAESMHRRALEIRKRIFGNKHADVANSMRRLGHVLWRAGKLGEAETMATNAVAMQRELFGNEHLELAMSLNDLSAILNTKGKRADAETVLREALAMQRKLLRGQPSLDLVETLGNLGAVTSSQPNTEEREAMSRERLQIQTQILTENHPLVIFGKMEAKAQDLERRGKLAEAEGVRTNMLAEQKRYFGSENPEVARSLNRLANVLEREQKLDAAESARREAVRVQQKWLGGSNYELAVSLQRLGSLLMMEGKLPEAEDRLRQALSIFKELPLEDDHPSVTSVTAKLISVLYEQGKLEQGETLLRNTLAVRSQAAHDEAGVAETLIDLAQILRDQNRLADAETIVRRAIATLTRSASSNLSLTLPAVNVYAEVLERQSRRGEAKAAYQDFFTLLKPRLAAGENRASSIIRKSASGLQAEGKTWQAELLYRGLIDAESKTAQPVELAASLHSFSSLLDSEHKLAEAGALSRRELLIRKELPNDERGRASTFHNLGNISRKQGQFVDAAACFREAIAIGQTITNYLEMVASSLYGLAGVLELQGDSMEAEKLVRQAFAVRTNRPAVNDATVAQALKSLALWLSRNGKLSEGETLFRQALALETTLQAKNPDISLSAVFPLDEVLRLQGKELEADKLLDETLASQRRLFENDKLRLVGLLLNFASRFEAQGKLSRPEALLQEAYHILAARPKAEDPEDKNLAEVASRLASLLSWQHRFAEAEPFASKLVAILQKREPDDWLTFDSLTLFGRILIAQDKLAEAEPLLLAAYKRLKERQEFIPDESQALVAEACEQLVQLSMAKGRTNEALKWKSDFNRAELERLRRLSDEGNVAAWNSLAWLMATCPDSAFRDGQAALEFAQKAVAATNRKNPGYLDTLAAACAEAHDFQQAREVQHEAMALLKDGRAAIVAGVVDVRESFEARLRLYTSEKPFREDKSVPALFGLTETLVREGRLSEAESIGRERLENVRSNSTVLDITLAGALADLAHVLVLEGKHVEAQPFALECLTIRQQAIPENWRTFNIQSILGGSLLGQFKYADAEPLLLAGYDGLKKCEDKIPPAGKFRLKEAAQRLLQLYQAVGPPDKAAEWQKKLIELEPGEEEKAAATEVTERNK